MQKIFPGLRASLNIQKAVGHAVVVRKGRYGAVDLVQHSGVKPFRLKRTKQSLERIGDCFALLAITDETMKTM
jgi:hypothetical protein